MKTQSIPFWFVFVLLLCGGGFQTAFAKDPRKIKIDENRLQKIEPKKQSPRLQPQFNRDMLRIIDIGKLRFCATSPSCNDSDYELSKQPCDEYGSSELFAEGCYICSLKSEIRSAVVPCADGFGWWGSKEDPNRSVNEDGVAWYDHIGYECRSECMSACSFDDKCQSACPAAPSGKDLCPSGWTQEITRPGFPAWGYTCHYRVNVPPPCGQCGSQAFGDNTANGDIFCAPWPPRPAGKK